MKKILIGVIITILLTLCMFSLLPSNTYATSIGNIITGADDFLNKGQADDAISEGTIKDMSNILYSILLVIAIVVAVIVGMMIGIKFMTGSVEEKAKVKETFIAYVAGCIVVFGAFTIWKVIVTILQS